MNITDSIKGAWNAFSRSRSSVLETATPVYGQYVSPSYTRPNRKRLSRGTEKTILNGIYSKMAVDASMIDFRHVLLDENENFVDIVRDSIDMRLHISTNTDQTPTAFFQDLIMSMFDEGHAVVVPVERDDEENEFGIRDIYSLRVGKVVQWYPNQVQVECFNQKTQKQERILIDKNDVCIIENPFYSIMNEYNSTAQRIIRKLSLLDSIDEEAGSGKLDIIMQLPYTIRGESKRKLAEERRNDIEDQLKHSRYGIGYIDATERITQLNRPAENNILKEIEYLNNHLLTQLGIPPSIIDGTADDAAKISYYNSAITPILRAISEGLTRTFFTEISILDGHRIMYFRDIFKDAPVTQMAELVDKFSRNEVLTGNELRGKIGYPPSSDPQADQLINKNISHNENAIGSPNLNLQEGENQNEV
ncbi:MAG: phage portal protein [Clostridiales bacterium]|nr:phage portal protein [Clostridiales bacterium]